MKAVVIFIVFVSFCTFVRANVSDQDETHENGEHSSEPKERYMVAEWNWHHVQLPLTIVIWILFASFAKILFHTFPRLVEMFPDSSLLITLGLLIGLFLKYVLKVDTSSYTLGSQTFFLYLLFPIVFDAGYYMHNRAFFDNLGTISMFAVVGTLWNVFSIGISLWAIGQAEIFEPGDERESVPFLSMFVFASLISAVDPVAVLVVFEEVHVNEMLYINVFGESLLNDAVTVVLYNMFLSFTEIGSENLIAIDYFAGLLSFFVVGLGGIFVGVVWALIISITTKYSSKVKILNPLFIIVMSYAAYLCAECLKLSAILAAVFCGIVCKQWAKENMSHHAQTTVRYMIKMMSSMSETVIFMFLGLSTVESFDHWDTAFVALTVFFCLVYRSIGCVVQVLFLNRYRVQKFNVVETFILSYGGLRGAIAYGLVVALPEDIKAKHMFVTATIVVIYFTVFLQGMTIKPLVNCLKVQKAEEHKKLMTEHCQDRMMDFIMSGLEDLCGVHGHHWFRDKYEQINSQYLRPIFVRNATKARETRIVKSWTRINLSDALNFVKGQEVSSSFAATINRQYSALSLVKLGETPSQTAMYDNPTFEGTNTLTVPTIPGIPKLSNIEEEEELDMDNVWAQKPKRRYTRHDAGPSEIDLEKLRDLHEAMAHKRLRKMSLAHKQASLDIDDEPAHNNDIPIIRVEGYDSRYRPTVDDEQREPSIREEEEEEEHERPTFT